MRLTDGEIEDLIYLIRYNFDGPVHNAGWRDRLCNLLDKFVRESYRRNYSWWQWQRWF